ncbi:hypothetical protein CSKR_107953 [Clonorchis sinensis]|uniref:Uncharacterized protein n=1 Tax=Clonorchis sinensis TaxID=79923 RepID=A0A3R7F3K8_CLOSI|nr:hypothetical protein CSKR_107953 [Clonorchis sinensis]
MVKFQPTVQQVGMNVSWSQLGSIGEFVVFAVNGTSGRGHGREKEWNSCGSAIELGMAVPCHHWPDMLQFLDSPAGRGNKVERSRYGIAGFFWDPVVEHHRPGGVGNSQPGPPNQALPKFEAWEDEGPHVGRYACSDWVVMCNFVGSWLVWVDSGNPQMETKANLISHVFFGLRGDPFVCKAQIRWSGQQPVMVIESDIAGGRSLEGGESEMRSVRPDKF